MRCQPVWMKMVKVGDVLRRGKLDRVVRDASFYNNGQLHTVTFSIRQCSWTGRAYTIFTYTDLKFFGYRPTGVRVRLRSPLDKKLKQDLLFKNRASPKLTCCDVHGVA